MYYFDHDLGFTTPGTSGYDILKWALANAYILGEVVLVTNNPVGLQNMANLLEDYGFNRLGNRFKPGVLRDRKCRKETW